MKNLKTQLLKNATYLLGDSKIQDIVNQALASISMRTTNAHFTSSENSIGKHRCKHFHLMPHHPLPNCLEYSRENSKYDIVSALFGKVRRENKGKELITNWKNVKANKFVQYYMNYLGHLRDKGHSAAY